MNGPISEQIANEIASQAVIAPFEMNGKSYQGTMFFYDVRQKVFGDVRLGADQKQATLDRVNRHLRDKGFMLLN